MERVSFDMSDFLEKIDLNKVLRYVLLMFLTLMAQNMVFSHIRPFGVCPMVLPAMAAAVGMFEGATWGPLLSMVMGYFADMSFVEHRVFFLLVLPGVSLLSAFLSQFFVNRRFLGFLLLFAGFCCFLSFTTLWRIFDHRYVLRFARQHLFDFLYDSFF